MVEGYCPKCKSRREIVNGQEETMSNGRVIHKGSCDKCGEDVVKIIEQTGGEESEFGSAGSLEPVGV